MTEDRDKWRKYVRGVANPRIEDGKRTEHNRTGTWRYCGVIVASIQHRDDHQIMSVGAGRSQTAMARTVACSSIVSWVETIRRPRAE